MKYRYRARRRRGSVLILMAMLMFVFFAVAALVIDLGLVWVSQSRMTSAADSASLEGLRWRDQFPDTVTDPYAYVVAGGGDPTNAADVSAARDRARRDAAAGLASIQFADNDPPQPRDERFGAGPIFLQEPGTISTPELNAGAILLPGNPTVYKPRLQSNDGLNLENGDIVAGLYDSDINVSHREGAVIGADPFSREDFAVSAAADAPASASLLVRMRHSRDEAVAGVASTGPAIPYLFGRGAFLPGTANAYGYAPRRDGITVRATAIANTAPAVYVGLPIVSAAVQGVGPIAFTRGFWENSLPPVDDAGDGTAVPFVLSGTSVIAASGPAGMLLASNLQTIGAVPVVGAASLPTSFRGYFPIVQQVPSGAMLVIGFGWAEVDMTGGTGSVIKVSKAGGAIAPRNASADLRLAWPALGPPVLSEADRTAVRNANATLKDPLLVPVLVRATGN